MSDTTPSTGEMLSADLKHVLSHAQEVYQDLLSLSAEFGPTVEHMKGVVSLLERMHQGASLGLYRELVKAEAEEKQPPVLSDDQKKAWRKLQRWAFSDPTEEPYFILRGYPGTGKTHLMKMLADLPVSLFFSAPTHKATKVLTKATGVPAKTTFSTLGLRMVHDEEELVMEYGSTPPEFNKGDILVVDETSMIGHKLLKFIRKVRRDFNIKVLFVGDPAQLNPIGEKFSRAWKITDDVNCRAFLKHVFRYDNQLLKLSQRIRDHMVRRDWRSPVRDDHDTTEGVWLLPTRKQFEAQIAHLTAPEQFLNTKVVAWRNKTVERYNVLIRESLGFKERFCVGDLLMLAAPIEEDGSLVAHIDDEFTVTQAVETELKIYDEDGSVDIPIHRLTTVGDAELILNIPVNEDRLNRLLSLKAKRAKEARDKNAQRELWREFWAVKARFHSVRYGYACTAHRIQGTTLDTVFMDQRDILINREKAEAFRALMVACTRPTHRLITY